MRETQTDVRAGLFTHTQVACRDWRVAHLLAVLPSLRPLRLEAGYAGNSSVPGPLILCRASCLPWWQVNGVRSASGLHGIRSKAEAAEVRGATVVRCGPWHATSDTFLGRGAAGGEGDGTIRNVGRESLQGNRMVCVKTRQQSGAR